MTTPSATYPYTIDNAVFPARRFRTEFGMAEVPAPVQRLVFPVLAIVGRLLGRYARYADAPRPVRP